jgi:hypothetical protein
MLQYRLSAHWRALFQHFNRARSGPGDPKESLYLRNIRVEVLQQQGPEHPVHFDLFTLCLRHLLLHEPLSAESWRRRHEGLANEG